MTDTSAGALQPSSGASEVVSQYYRLIQGRRYREAYDLLAIPWRPGYRFWLAQYRGYPDSRLTRLNAVAYLIPSAGAQYTCVGLRIAASLDGGPDTGFGGWYMTVRDGDANWRIVIMGSETWQGAPAYTPSRAACATVSPLAEGTDVSPCRAAFLYGTALWQPGPGTRFGAITLTNRDRIPCRTQGWPQVSVEAPNGRTLKVQEGHAEPFDEPLQGSGGRRLLVIPGEGVRTELSWTNWCSWVGTSRAKFVIGIPGAYGTTSVMLGGSHSVRPAPPCLNPSRPSWLIVSSLRVGTIL
jgi:Protein of unknown function (DUF4232)